MTCYHTLLNHHLDNFDDINMKLIITVIDFLNEPLYEINKSFQISIVSNLYKFFYKISIFKTGKLLVYAVLD